MIDIKVEGADSIAAKLRALPENIKTQALANMAEVARASAFKGADKHTKTGRIIGSLALRPIKDGWEIWHDARKAKYAKFVHWGAREHPIGPRQDKPRASAVSAHTRYGHQVRAHTRHIVRQYLRWAVGGRFIFARFVPKHPGYRGDPWLVHAGEDAIHAFDGIVAKLQRTM